MGDVLVGYGIVFVVGDGAVEATSYIVEKKMRGKKPPLFFLFFRGCWQEVLFLAAISDAHICRTRWYMLARFCVYSLIRVWYHGRRPW